MNKETLNKLLQIIFTADDGCSNCVHSLLTQLVKDFNLSLDDVLKPWERNNCI